MSRLQTALACLLPAAALTAAALATASPASATGPSTCHGVVQITQMAFKPPAVFPGQSSTVHLVALNCTDQRIKGSVTWLGRWVGATTGLPRGCPAIDPLPGQANFGPHGTFVGQVTYLVPGGCTAVGLQVTATISSGPDVLARRSANLTITRPPT